MDSQNDLVFEPVAALSPEPRYIFYPMDESILAVVFLKSLQTRALNYSSLQSGAFDLQVSGYWKTKL
ncbi:hypothetical protein BJAS_P4580 [Bathymodiolus japonicus methanotrophic gill symbiont]|nr:hypothetical protein BJAS_P4580 [Bathymodiolus japonicus methanotrophic gill symbiont]